MPFIFQKTAIPDVLLITPELFGDERGFFMETFKESAFKAAGIAGPFVQDNHSHSTKNVLRGLHYQKAPYGQGKLVRVALGAIFDVAVDIRPHSPSFLKWVGFELSAENRHQLYIPAGFAHGFLTLSESADLIYKTTAEYNQSADAGIIWNDPDIAISWPLSGAPILSPKDQKQPLAQAANLN